MEALFRIYFIVMILLLLLIVRAHRLEIQQLREDLHVLQEQVQAPCVDSDQPVLDDSKM